MVEPYRLLLTSAGGAMAGETVRRLKESPRHRLSVVAVDMRTDAPAAHLADAFFRVPAGDDPGYVDAVREVVAKTGVDLILPASDEEALALASARDAGVDLGATLAAVSAERLEEMSDKIRTYRRLSEVGLAAPLWRAVASVDALETAVRDLVDEVGEIAVKPGAARGGRFVYVLRRDLKGTHPFNEGREVHCDMETFLREHMQAAAEHLPLVVMERLHEPVFDIDVLCDRGRMLRAFARRRLNPAGVPFHGNEIVVRRDLEELAGAAAAAFDLSWLYDIDVMSAADGSPRVLEMNPRMSGSIAAAACVGVPILDDLISLAKGEPLPPTSAPTHRFVRPYLSVFGSAT